MNKGSALTLPISSVVAEVSLLTLAISYVVAGMLNVANATPDDAISQTPSLTYPIVDTNITECYGVTDKIEQCPSPEDITFGQDAQYQGFSSSYTDNKDGTVTDNVTGLIWAQTVDINGDGNVDIKDKMTYSEAVSYANQSQIGGYDDWRVPSIKELYSLIMFDGQDPEPGSIDGVKGSVSMIPFIDASVFGFNSGDTQAGERLIDSQYLSSTKYVSTTMNDNETVFGVNFIDGRIKGYGVKTRAGEKKFYVLLARGNTDYGVNHFVDNKNGTISDTATHLTWQKSDSVEAMDWSSALAYCENLTLAGHNNWRLPNAKELQSIVDYNKSPDTSNSAAISTMFNATPISNEAGQTDYANYWSSSTHINSRNKGSGIYVAFGRSLGYWEGQWVDVHGAGSQRSDPKAGDTSQYPQGRGPQGDAVRINNHARCVTSDTTMFVQQPVTTVRESITYTLNGNETPTNFHNDRSTKQPPKEAIEACASKAVDTSCTINIPDGTLTGQCQLAGQTKACVPDRRPI